MSEAIVGSMLSKLQQLAVREARALAAVDEDIRSLRDKLMWMQAFLHDVQPSRRVQPNELIKVWLQQTRDSVFDAEDAVDQYFIQIDLSRFPSWSRAMVNFFAGFTTQCKVRYELSRRIKSINARLEEIIANKDRYRMGESTTLGSTWRPSISSTSTLSANMDDVVLPLVGREEQMGNLKYSLVKSSDHHLVITVTGESGVGKTKLVRHLYDRSHILSQFNIHEWVSFGLNLSASDVLKLIIRRIDGEECSSDQIKAKLKEILEGQKYLLVIDAELSNTEWNRIFALLPKPKDVKAGSRIVRISQSTPAKPPPGYEETRIPVTALDDEKAVIDLFKVTFRAEIPAGAIDKYRKKILSNTKGLPLVVVLLSGLLRTKEYPNEWKTVFDHLKKMQSKQIDKILSLCFDDLHYDLKSCLLYFAALPVNNFVRAQNIVCIWMAEGFLIPKATTAEKVGEQYLKELIDRCLVNLAPTSYILPGHERVAVQSKVHAFLQIEAQEQSFVEIHSGDDTPALSTVRRLSLQNHRDKYAALASPLPKLRAILSNFETVQESVQVAGGSQMPDEAAGGSQMPDEAAGGQQPDGHEDGSGGLRLRPNPPHSRCCPALAREANKIKKQGTSCVQELLKNSKFLRVIHFNSLEVGSELPAELGGVVNLQYLRVTSCSLEKIPSSIGRLGNLQTVDVRGTKVKSLPADLWQIQMLRHVLGDRLILPKHVGRLRNLQTLSTVRPDGDATHGGWDVNTFTNMIRLWYLHIRLKKEDGDLLCNHDNRAAVVKAVDKDILKYLVVLIIKAPSIPLQVFTKADLQRLKAMELVGELVGDSQSGIPNLPNLRKLQLKETMVSQEFINKLTDLQFLSTLALGSNSYRDKQLIFKSGFHCLKELTVHAEKLSSIEIHESALPALQDLDIHGRSSDLRVVIHGHSNLIERIEAEECVRQVPVENNKE